MDKIAVLIPCYNEEKTVEKVVRDFKAVLPEAVIYVYDNNSSDRTVELAEKAGAVVRHEYICLLYTSIYIIENLKNLEKIGKPRCSIIASPLKIKGATGSPVRVIAIV